MELNKVVAAFCSTLLVFLGLGFFSELIFNSHKSEELAYMLEVEEADSGEAVVDVDLTAVFAAADPAKGEKVFKKCAACHKLEDGANATGPYLYGVVNRDVDSAKGYTTYSGALPVGEKWTRRISSTSWRVRRNSLREQPWALRGSGKLKIGQM